jgi:hypothetical protein
MYQKVRKNMSMKDALKKAGLKSSRTQNDRKKIAQKDKKNSERHQETRNFCEVCDLIQPDVEMFKHKNPTIDAEWICTACADREQIHDQFRVTNQSEFAKSKRYRREFGPTQEFKKNSTKGSGIKKSERQEESNFNIDDDGSKNFNC